MSRVIPALLWLIFAIALVIAGAMITRACGSFLPFSWFCDDPVPEAQTLAARHQALLAERDALIEQLRRAPQCRAPEMAPQREASAQCQPPPTDETLVLIDVSFSMEWDYQLPDALTAEIARLENQMARTQSIFQRAPLQAALDQAYEKARTPAEPDRIDVARQALRPLIGGLNGDARLRMLSFAQCRVPIRQEGTFGRNDTAAYERMVDGLRLRPSTALAEAIDALPGQTEAGRSPDRPLNIVILSDGEDSCGGDPCAAAARLRQALPHAYVSVVSLAPGAGANACIADATQGQFVTAANADDMVARLRQTTGQLDASECAAMGLPAQSDRTPSDAQSDAPSDARAKGAANTAPDAGLNDGD